MSTIAKTAAPQHGAQRLISVLESRRRPLERPGVCGRCYTALSIGDSVTAVREPEGTLVVHERCAGWNEPLSREEMETAFDEIFGARGYKESRRAP